MIECDNDRIHMWMIVWMTFVMFACMHVWVYGGLVTPRAQSAIDCSRQCKCVDDCVSVRNDCIHLCMISWICWSMRVYECRSIGECVDDWVQVWMKVCGLIIVSTCCSMSKSVQHARSGSRSVELYRVSVLYLADNVDCTCKSMCEYGDDCVHMWINVQVNECLSVWM